MLVRHGYGVLLLDARGYDGSQGDPNVFGWDDAKDIDAAVAWLRHQPDVRGGRIGGIGFSVGGEMMLQAAASNTRLRAVVSEGAGFRSVREDAAARSARLVHTPGSRSPDRRDRRHERNHATPSAQGSRTEDRSPTCLLHLRGPRRWRRGI